MAALSGEAGGLAGPRRKVLVVASLSWSLVNFRGRLLAAMVAGGADVVAAAPDEDPEVRRALAAIGVRFARIPMQRTGLGPLADVGTLKALVVLLRKEQPDTVLAYTQKPIVYTGLACRLTGIGRFHAMVSGLGYAFSGEGRGLLRVLVARMYRIALEGAASVILFNSDDRAEMEAHAMLPPDTRIVVVPGSGIDTGHFTAAPLPDGPPVFLMVARLLVHKGVREYAEAARILREVVPDAEVRLLGPEDPNPAGLPRAELEAWHADGTLAYLGETRDVAPHLAGCHVFVLPTWYREGLPRTILEAMASGRAVIATDAPGCRDAVVPGATGLLVPVRDAAALGAAMLQLARDRELVERMGAAGRARAEAIYAVERVNALLLQTLDLVPSPAGFPAPEPALAA